MKKLSVLLALLFAFSACTQINVNVPENFKGKLTVTDADTEKKQEKEQEQPPPDGQSRYKSTEGTGLDIDADDNNAVDRTFGGTNVDLSASPGAHRGLGFNNSSGAIGWFSLGSGLEFGVSPFSLNLALNESLGSWGNITDGDATPDVSTEWTWKLTDDGTTDVDTITAFDGGSDGMVRYFLFVDNYWTIDFSGTTLKGNGGADWSPSANDTMVCINDGTNWNCLISVASGSGDVTAASSFGTDNVIVRSDGTGKGVQATGCSIDDSDKGTFPGGIETSASGVGTIDIYDSAGDNYMRLTVSGDWSANKTVTFPENDMTPAFGTGPTIDSLGDFGVDTTDDQWVYYGGAKRVVTYKHRECFTLEDPAAADDNVPIFSHEDAITVTKMRCWTEGGTSVEVILSDGTNDLDTMTCDDDGADDDGSISNATFTAAEQMEFDIGTVTGSVDWVNFCFTYTITAE